MHFTGKVITDQQAIRLWAQAREGWPAFILENTGNKQVTRLHLCFPDCKHLEAPVRISWEEFFEVFEQQQLAFIYQEQPSNDSNRETFLFI